MALVNTLETKTFRNNGDIHISRVVIPDTENLTTCIMDVVEYNLGKDYYKLGRVYVGKNCCGDTVEFRLQQYQQTVHVGNFVKKGGAR